MESRMEKYHDVDIENFQRSRKNVELYKEVYGNYGDFEDLPIPENTNEIDIDNLKSLVESRSSRKKELIESQVDFSDDIIDIPKEEKVYDINTLLEIAKEENAKIKKEIPICKNVPNYLANLESDQKTKDIILKYDGDKDDDLPIVNGTNYSTSNINTEKSNSSTSSLSLDILSDLKPSGDTLVSEPIDVEDSNDEDKKFFDTQSSFVKEDFVDDDNNDDEIFYEEKSNSFIKFLLLVVGLSSVFVALYFVIKEYTNIF